MCSHSAPPLIMRLHSAVSCPKSEASTDGEIIARGMLAAVSSCMSSSESEIISCREINLVTYTPGRTRMTLWRRCLWKTPAPPASIQPWINSDQPDYRRHTATGVFFLDQFYRHSYKYLDRKHIPSLPSFAHTPFPLRFSLPTPTFYQPCSPALPPLLRSSSSLSLSQPHTSPKSVRVRPAQPPNSLAPAYPPFLYFVDFDDITSDIGSAFNGFTSVAGSFISEATSAAASAFTGLTSDAGSVFTRATSDAGSVFTQATSLGKQPLSHHALISVVN